MQNLVRSVKKSLFSLLVCHRYDFMCCNLSFASFTLEVRVEIMSILFLLYSLGLVEDYKNICCYYLNE